MNDLMKAVLASALTLALAGYAHAGKVGKGSPNADDGTPGNSGSTVAIDKDGKLRAPTREESEALLQQMGRYLDQRTDGLTPRVLPNGAIGLDLQDRFQDVAIAKIENGRVDFACVDSVSEAKAFLESTPQSGKSQVRERRAGVRPSGLLEEK
jgi:hypothetical protein